jgi:hypothetical protein
LESAERYFKDKTVSESVNNEPVQLNQVELDEFNCQDQEEINSLDLEGADPSMNPKVANLHKNTDAKPSPVNPRKKIIPPGNIETEKPTYYSSVGNRLQKSFNKVSPKGADSNRLGPRQ